MLFTQSAFLFFFAIVFLVYWTLPGHLSRKIWLLISSAFFYGCWDWRFLFLLFASAMIDYAVGIRLGRAVSPRSRKLWITASVTAQLTILGFFKYFNFFVASGVGILTWMGIHVGKHELNIILPVGISFYTFQSMSYTIDVYRGRMAAVKSPIDFALYVSFFPQLIAGPIARAINFLPQLKEKKIFGDVAFRSCLGLFLSGYFKKACIADNISPLVDRVFAMPRDFSALSLAMGAVLYAVQIYCDFSGYTDMATAVAGLMGYKLAKNFRFPYFSASIMDFWRRWHISLTSWFRDYLYTPLTWNVSLNARARRMGSMLLTFAVSGLWHGAGWNFVVWGVMHGLALGIYMVFTERFELKGLASRVMSLLAPFLTIYWVFLAWIFFRAKSISDALIVARAFVFLGSKGTQTLDPSLCLWLIPCVLLHWICYKRYFADIFQRLPDWAFAACYASAIVLILPFVSYAYKPFIYFQF